MNCSTDILSDDIGRIILSEHGCRSIGEDINMNLGGLARILRLLAKMVKA